MLDQLTIKNFALIDELSIEFSNGLNVLTGETGAGKSILIDALRYALGEKINTSQIRNTKKPCIVEATFTLSSQQLKEYRKLSEYLQDSETTLIISRTYTNDGRNKNKINGFNITLAQLKETGNHLVDFHGPNDHQMLLISDTHLAIVDRLTPMGNLKKDYTNRYNEYSTVSNKIKELEELASSRERELDLFSHQIKELEQVPLDPEKYTACLNEQSKINSLEKLCSCTTQLITVFEGEQYSVTELLNQAFPVMQNLTSTDKETLPFAETLSNLQTNKEELLTGLQSYLDSLSFDPETAQTINSHSDIYTSILRKYGPSIEDAKNHYEKIRKQYNLLINLETNKSDLDKQARELKKELQVVATKISSQRQKTAILLKTTIEKELKELGINHAQFECRLGKVAFNPNGWDSAIFYISPNAGESLKPLSEIVSSGEAARVMLALKKALTKVDPIPVLIFDEIDAQIGGRLGNIIGKKLKEISQKLQVILISHLPQIASFAKAHFKVFKQVKNNKTHINVTPLDNTARTQELAQMMSGHKESKISLKHAQEMLAKAN